MRASAALYLCVLLAGTARAEDRAEDYGARARILRPAALGATTLDAESAAQRPAALSEPARALLDAPGLSRSSFAGSELLIWGAAGNETRVYVDGVEIPALYHPAGFRSTVHPVLIERLSLTPGAPAADYGRGLGGVVELTSKRARDGAELSVSADAIDASISGRLVERGSGILCGFRYGYLDRVVNALAPQTSDVLAVPAHADGAVKLMLRADAESDLSLTWIGSHDRVDAAREDGHERTARDFHSFALKLERRYDDGARVLVTPFVGFGARRERSVFSALPVRQEREGVQFGLRASYSRSFGWLTLQLGLDLKGTRDRLARSGTLSLPAREGDIQLFGQVPVDAIAADSWHTTIVNAAPQLTLSFHLRALTIEPGLRLESMLISASRSLPTNATVPAVGVDNFYTFLEPRLRVAYRLLKELTVEARVAIVHQAPESTDLSAVFGSPTLRPARAIHATLGPRLELPRAFVLECVGYYRYLTDLAVRTDQVPPALAQALVSSGKGQSYGASLAVRGEPVSGLSIALSYTLGKSTRTDAAGHVRLFDHDQTHVLSALLGYAAQVWSSSLGLRAATGSPYTAVVDHYDDSTSGRAEPLFGAHNAARLPFYFQVNLHAEYRFLSEPFAAALLLDVLNLTNQKNVEQIGYDANYEARRDVTGLPVLAMLGVRVGYP